MNWIVHYALVVVVLVVPSFAEARSVIDRAVIPTVGCYARNDLVDVLHAGHMTKSLSATSKKLNTAVEAKVRAGRCFRIAAGQMAYMAPEWQNAGDVWGGLVIFKTQSGRKFYSAGWNWRYAGEPSNLIP